MTQTRGKIVSLELLETRRLLSAATRVVGFFPEYRFGVVNSVDFSKVTHVNYFSVVANNDGSISTANINLQHMATLVTKVHNAHDSIGITVGPRQFDAIANNATALANFVTNMVNFAVNNHFDAIDVDWEPPSGTAAPVYKTLLDALYAQAHPRGLMLTEDVNPITHELPLNAVGDLDWINVMGYNFTLADPSGLTVSENAMASWASYGVPAAKLVLGLPFYGLGPSSYGDAQTYSDLQSYYASTHSGVMAGPGVDDIVYSNGHNYKFNGATTVTNKTNYVVNNNYGGMMTWELGQDHFNGAGYDQYSLLPAMSTAMASSVLAIPGTPASPSIADNSNIAARPTLDWADSTSATSYNVYVDGNFVQSVATSQLALPQSLVLTPNVAHSWQVVSINASHRSFGPVWHFTINPIAADANLDGIVNAIDFTILASNFQKTGMSWLTGDFNADGKVNALDFNAIATNYGNTAPTGATALSMATSSPGGPVATLFSAATVADRPDADLISPTAII
jgi:hypothetical protein